MRKLTWLLGAMLLLLSLTGCGNKVDSESIRSYLESSYYNESDASVDEIKDIDLDDGVTFEIKEVSNIMDEMEYLGICFTMNAIMGKLVTPMKIDISTED